MNRTAQFVLTSIVLLALQFRDGHQISAAQSPATIDGIVLDAATSQPLAGVQIGISTTGVTPVAFNPSQGRVEGISTTTNAEGRFSLELKKEAGRFRVVPKKDGYIYARPGQKQTVADPGVWVQVATGERVTGLELRMARTGVISGRVLDSNGNPIVGNAGSVTLQRYSYGADGKRALSWVQGIVYPGAAGSFQRMNDQGEFRFYDLPPGEYYLSVSGGGGAIGSARSYFYPGVADEAKAVPIRVVGGDDIKLGTLALPPRDKGVELKLRIPGEAATASVRRLYVGDNLLVMSSAANPNEIVLSVAPGHYDLLFRTESLLRATPLVYASATVDVGASGVEQELVVKPAAAITGSILVQNEAGARSPAPQAIRCQLRSRFGLDPCVGSQVIPGPHDFEFQGLPADMYLLSARIGDRDVLAEGLTITGDTQLEIVLATPGSIVQGVVRGADGKTLPDAVIALVPDAPFTNVGPRYRSVISDPQGKYEIHGIAPGSYKLFAWPELEGVAYRSADFMKEFDERGKPVKVEKGPRQTVDLTAF